MADDKETTDGEAQLVKALQQMREENKRQAAELAASQKALIDMKADLALGAAMDASDSRPAARAFATKLIRQEVKNVRLDRDGNVVCDFGEHEGIGADAAVAAFIAANDFLQPVTDDSPEGLDLPKLAPKPTDVSALATDSLGNAIPMHELSSDELFANAGAPPEAPPPKPTRARVLSESDRELSSDELFAAAGEAPWER